MSAPLTNSLAEFRTFIGLLLEETNGSLITPEEALARWQEHQEIMAAIREGLADIKAERTRPVEEMVSELKSRLSAIQSSYRTLPLAASKVDLRSSPRNC